MTTFYFVRHGQTELNVVDGFNGGLSNPPLTAQGKEEARRVGQALATHRFTQVLTSSMPRARRTAALIMAANHAQATTPIRPVNGLREIIQGDWDGKTTAQIDDPAKMQVYLHEPDRFDAEVADSLHFEHYAAVEVRTQIVIESAVAAHPSGQILVVAHGVSLRILINHLLGYPLNHFRTLPALANAAVTKLATAPGGRFTSLYYNVLPADLPAAEAAAN